MASESEEQQVVMISGAGAGIGRQSALAFAKLDYRLVLIERQADLLQETAQLCAECSPHKVPPLELAVDLASGERVARAAVDSAVAQFGRLDVLVTTSNQPPGQETKFDSPDCVDQYHQVVANSMHAVVYLSLAAYEPLSKTRGCVVIVSSALDDKPARFKFAACIAKSAISMLTKCLASDFAPKVRVNCVSPGPIVSSILDDMGLSTATDDHLSRRRASFVKRQDQESANQVAKMILYLSSKDKAASITGSRVLVDSVAGY